jgi:pimeloyl-ACP methyl ester carboxylesterase
VLVHGAFADGSSWARIIPLLEAKGLRVVAVQNPLSSLEDDVAATKRAIDRLEGPVLLVGHSWAGVVISQIGNDDKVAGLVYICAFAPDDNQSLNQAAQALPPGPGNDEVRPDAAGFLSLTPKGIMENFCQDLPQPERKVILATQGDWAASAPGQQIGKAAWKTKPSWYIVGAQDRMINPDLQRSFASRMKAKTLTLQASHVPMLSQPDKVAAFIAQAAQTVKPQ